MLDSLDIDCVEFFQEFPLQEIDNDSDDSDSSDSDDSDVDDGYNYNGGILVSRFTTYLTENRQPPNTAESSTQTEEELVISLFCPNGEQSQECYEKCRKEQIEAKEILRSRNESFLSKVRSYLWPKEESEDESDESDNDSYYDTDGLS